MERPLTPPKRFYPYACEKSKFLAFGGETVEGIRTYGDAVRLLMAKFRTQFGTTCPSLDALFKNRTLLTSGILATSNNLEQHGLDPETELERIVGKEGFIDSSFFHHWHHYRWHHNGRTIYDVHPALARAFGETELTIAPQVLRVDYPTVYLGLLDLGLTVWHQGTGEHRLNGMYCSIDKREGVPWLFVVVVGEALPGAADDDNALCSFSLPLDGQTEVEHLVRRIDAQPERARLLGPNAQRFVLWARLAVNSLLYVQHVAEDAVHAQDYGVAPEKQERAQKIKSRKHREIFLQRYRADVRYVQLGKKFAQAASSGSGGQAGEGAVVRHLVRGHWRWQACGRGRQERRLTWIKPHWRGEDEQIKAVTKIVTINGKENTYDQTRYAGD